MTEQSQKITAKSKLFDKRLRVLFISLLFFIFVFSIIASGFSVILTNIPQSESNLFTREKIINWVCDNLNKNYIFAKATKKMENYVQKQFKEGKYWQVNNISEFTEALTRDLQTDSKDEHIRVLINSNPPPFDSYMEGEKEKVLTEMMESDRRENFHIEPRIPVGWSFDPKTGLHGEVEGVEPNTKVSSEKTFDVAYTLALENLCKKTEGDRKTLPKWRWEYHEALPNPAAVASETLKNYAGMYGQICITYDGNELFILEPAEKNFKKLYPLSETLFVIEGNVKIRGQFERNEKREVTAIIGKIADGSKQRIPKVRKKLKKPERAGEEILRDHTSRTSPNRVNDKIFDELDIGFAYVEGGSFLMGDTFGEGRRSEIPVHNVTLDGFYLSTTEVTFAQYDRVCEETGREKPDDNGFGREKRPVVNVSWNDAVAFCLWLSEKSGRPVRLPTEAEWEYAARERGKKVRFGNGQDTADPSEINFDASEKLKEPYSRSSADTHKTLPVASFPPNALGLYDMSGNVWEWVADWFDEYYYRNSPVENPTGPASGTYRVLRGGAWRFGPRSARCANRGCYVPGEENSEIGFRLAIMK